MDNEIVFYTASYLFTRLAVVAAFAYAFYRVLRPAPALARNKPAQSASSRHRKIVFDDHC